MYLQTRVNALILSVTAVVSPASVITHNTLVTQEYIVQLNALG